MAASIGLNGLGFVQGSSSVLQIGCGNSNLGEQLHDSCGIGTAHSSFPSSSGQLSGQRSSLRILTLSSASAHLINLDLSATVISHMQQKRPDLHYLEGDALRLTPQFGEDAFDAVRHANSRLLCVRANKSWVSAGV